METLQTIKTKIEKMIEQNNKDIQNTEAELIKANQAVSNAQEKLIQAQKEIDSQKYVKAKDELWIAEHTREFYDKQLTTLKKSPLIPYEEFHAMIKDVEKLANEEQKTYFELANEKIKEINKLGDKALEKAQSVDALLKNIVKELGKNNEDYKKTKDGAIISDLYCGISYKPRHALYYHQGQLEKLFNHVLDH